MDEVALVAYSSSMHTSRPTAVLGITSSSSTYSTLGFGCVLVYKLRPKREIIQFSQKKKKKRHFSSCVPHTYRLFYTIVTVKLNSALVQQFEYRTSSTAVPLETPQPPPLPPPEESTNSHQIAHLTKASTEQGGFRDGALYGTWG